MLEIRIGARRRAGGAYAGYSLDGEDWQELKNVWMRDWVAQSRQQRNRFATSSYAEWSPTGNVENCPFKRSSRRKFLRLPEHQQHSACKWVMDNLLSKSKPIFVISNSGDLVCNDMDEEAEPSWVNCSFRYGFDATPRTLRLSVNGVCLEFAIPKSAELAIRECFRHPGVTQSWCDAVCLNIVYIVTGDKTLTSPMYNAMGETFLRAQTCILETALQDELYYSRAWTVQEWLLSKPLQGEKQCYCQLLQPKRRPQLVNFSKTSSAGQVILVISKMIAKVKESDITDPDERPMAALSLIRALGFIDRIPATIGGATHNELFSQCSIALAQVMLNSTKPSEHMVRKHSCASVKSARVCAMLLSCMAQPDIKIMKCECTTIDGTLVGPVLNDALDRMTFSSFDSPPPHKEKLLTWVLTRLKTRHGLQGVQEFVISLLLDILYLPFAVLGLLLELIASKLVRRGQPLQTTFLDWPARIVVSLGVLMGTAVVQLDVRSAFLRKTEWSHPIRMRNPALSILGLLVVFVPDMLSGEPSGRASLLTRILTTVFYCLSWTDETAEGLTTTTVVGLVLYQTEHIPHQGFNVRWYFAATAGFAVLLALVSGPDSSAATWAKTHTLGHAMAFAWKLVCILTGTIAVYEWSTDCSAQMGADSERVCPLQLQLMFSWILPLAIMALWWLKSRAMHDSWSLQSKVLAWIFSLATTLALLFSGHPRDELCTAAGWCTFAVRHPRRLEVAVYAALGLIVVCIVCLVTPLRARVARWAARVAPPRKATPGRRNSVALGSNATRLVKPEEGCCQHVQREEMLRILEGCARGLRFGDDAEVLTRAEDAVLALVQALEARRLSHSEAFDSFDADADGFVSLLDLRAGFAGMDMLVSDEAVAAFFQRMCEGAAGPPSKRRPKSKPAKLHVHLPADRAAWQQMLATGHLPLPQEEEEEQEKREAGTTAAVEGGALDPSAAAGDAATRELVAPVLAAAAPPAPGRASLRDDDDDGASTEGEGLAAKAPLRRASTEAIMSPTPKPPKQRRPRRASITAMKPLEPLEVASSHMGHEKRSRKAKYAKPSLGRLKPLPLPSPGASRVGSSGTDAAPSISRRPSASDSAA